MSAEGVRERLSRLLRPHAAEDVREQLQARERRRAEHAVPPVDLTTPAGSEVLARRTAWRVTDPHGEWRLCEAIGADPRAFALLCKDPALSEIDLARALYLDTETSGLSGGAGTWVFLVGLGRFVGESFDLWQGFLRDPAEERALLAEVAERIRTASSVVSFFGKSFDRHRLEDKMRMHGIEPPFAGRPHLDLYYPLRRLYRPRDGSGLADGRLRTFEQALCGVAREDDLPGSRAPAAWFDFLHGRPHELEGVFRHNRDDVLSLVTLAAHLARTLDETRTDGSALAGPAAPRARAVARALHASRRHAEAVAWYERALEREPESLLGPELERARKRAGKVNSGSSSASPA